MTTFAEITDAAKFTADLVNTDRVTLSEWRTLTGDAVRSAWRLAASVRLDFQVASQDSVVVSGGAASFAVPAKFEAEIDVVYAPDTDNEYSLGAFAWQNRRSPGGWVPWMYPGAPLGGSRARLMGTTVYIEPARQAGGTYRLWYLPRPKTCEFMVDYASVAALGGHTTTGGPGPGRKMTEAGLTGILAIDGTNMVVGNRVLIKDQAGAENGIYLVTAATPGAAWELTRATDYDQSTEIATGDVVGVSSGATNINKFFELTTFAGSIDVDAILFSPNASVDAVLTPFRELLVIATALPAIDRDDDLNINRLEKRREVLEGELKEFFGRTRGGNMPSKPIDTDARGSAGWRGGW